MRKSVFDDALAEASRNNKTKLTRKNMAVFLEQNDPLCARYRPTATEHICIKTSSPLDCNYTKSRQSEQYLRLFQEHYAIIKACLSQGFLLSLFGNVNTEKTSSSN